MSAKHRSEDSRKVTVCDRCLQASCWQGSFMCDYARNAGVTDLKVAELRTLGREHPSYWSTPS